MCGISVVLQPPGGGETLQRMHAPIRHRGPDGEGFLWWDGQAVRRTPDPGAAARVGMAFRRLNILDPTPAGDQPMGSPDGTAWMVFNGEIYNHRTLRAELQARGRRFVTGTDTEVALAAWEAWGEECFARLDGMWGIVVLDLRRRRLVASRDRFGIKPLYWCHDAGRLLFASELKQVLAVREGRPVAYAPLVRAFIQGNRYPCLEETFFEGIRSVPPATWTAVDLDGEIPAAPRFVPYWRLSDTWCREPGTPYDVAREGFEAVLREAVASHRQSDVAQGSLLSGGLDSSVLTRLASDAARAEGTELPTFSFGYRGQDVPWCELPYVDALVRQERLVNHDTTIDAGWVAANMERCVLAMEEPPLAVAGLAQYRIFELVREHGVTVVLDGVASDEVLAGYPYHQRLLLADRLKRGRVAAFGREASAIAAREGRSVAAVVREHFLDPLRRRAATRSRVAPDYGLRADASEVLAVREDVGHDPSLVNRRLYFDVRWGNVKLAVTRIDKMAMAHSVEARVPFLDRALVELAFAMPDEHKVGRGERKRVLRDLGRRVLPREIPERVDRMGFGTPDIVRDGLAGAVREALAGGLLDEPCFDGPAVRELVRRHEAGEPDPDRAVWRLYALAAWQAAFGVRIS
jgi:asparagine synthase (glutamine-hydrolysing)